MYLGAPGIDHPEVGAMVIDFSLPLGGFPIFFDSAAADERSDVRA